MSTRDHWHDIEEIPPRAVQVTPEFIKSLIDEPSKFIVPKFCANTGRPLGIDATTPNSGTPLTVEMHDWLVHHPNGDIERVDGIRFSHTYTIRD